MTPDFDLTDFLPYLLNQAAERVSQEFQREYRGRYGMLRTEWRVLFHLGRYGAMTARDICDRAHLHKTKVSRAVAALEAKRYLTRTRDESDRRSEALTLTTAGQAVFADLAARAAAHHAKVAGRFATDEQAVLIGALRKLGGVDA